MKLTKRILAILLAALMVLSMAACGEKKDTPKDGKADIIAGIEALKDGKAEGLNTYESGFDDVVKYLTEQGVIDADAVPVDMTQTKGYLTDNTGTGDFEVYPFADKALDYNGVYVMWWDLKEPTEAISVYTGISVNQMLVVAGGAAVMPVTAWSGCYAIGFREDIDPATVDAGKKVFNEIDSKAYNIDYMTSATELALYLKDAGLIEAADIAAVKDLNTQYKYTALDYAYNEETFEYADTPSEVEYTVTLASEAKSFGKVTIYYFDTLSGLEYSENLDAVYAEAQANKVIKPYCCLDRTAMEYVYVPYTQKDGVYAEDGQALSLEVDIVIGRFAISVAD